MKAKTVWGAAAMFSFMVASSGVLAHHSFAAEFDSSKPVSFSGRLTRFDLVAPHSWIYVDVVGDDGKVTNWGVELGVPNMLIRQGVNKTTLKIGTTIVVRAFQARDGSATAAGDKVTFEDGRPIFTSARQQAPESK